MGEIDILIWIQDNFSSQLMDSLMIFLSQIATGKILWIILGLILLYYRKTRPIGAVVLLGTLFSIILCDLFLKNIIQRPRPFTEYPFELIISAPTTWSFPSGHTIGAFTFATAIFLYRKKEGSLLLILATMIAFSRLYLHVHYPSDVIAGAVLGIICAFSAYYVIHKYNICSKSDE